jgi:glycerol-3-phosphate dehydrogenase
LTQRHALAVSQKGGHFFIVPWRDHSIVGTTDTVYTDEPDALRVTAEEISAFLSFVNEGLPGLTLTDDHVCHAYAGLRPLVDDGAKSSYNASRKAEIVDHGAEGGPANLVSAIGGKWTTSRQVAEVCVNLVARHLQAETTRCDTAEAPLPGAAGNHRAKVAALGAQHRDISPSTVETLARNYGAMAGDVLAHATLDAALLRTVSQRLPDIAAQIVHAVRAEMALTLEDVVFRRTGLGTLGPLEPSALSEVASLMARELGWSAQETQRQIDSISWHRIPLSPQGNA